MAVHHFCTEDAARYGVEEAILLWNIGFWCATNLAKRQNIHDGRVWTYNPHRAYLELTPYLCPENPDIHNAEYPDEASREKAAEKELKRRSQKIRRIFKSLENQGAIVAGNYNKSKQDQTTWYSLNDQKKLSKYAEIAPEALKLLNLQICRLDSTDLSNGLYRFVDSSPDNKHRYKQVSQSTLCAREKSSADESGNFSEQVMAELLADHLPVHKHRYARLKIAEYQERFPESGSVADCYGYVVQAVTHQINLTGV